MTRTTAGFSRLPALVVTTFVIAVLAGAPSAYASPGQGFLPDNRVWEMVSPPDKNGGDISADSTRTPLAIDGGSAGFSSLTGFGDVQGTGIAVDYMAERSPEGWTTHAITPPQDPLTFKAAAGEIETRYVASSPDLSNGLLLAWSPLTEDPSVARVVNLYVRREMHASGRGAYQLASGCPFCEEAGSLIAIPPPPTSGEPNHTQVYRPFIAGASSDFSHVVFESVFRLTADAPPTDPKVLKLYESDEGVIRYVGLVPPGSATECGESGPACVSASRSIAGAGAKTHYTPNTISDDGRRIFFTVPSGPLSDETGRGTLYMREDDKRTVQVDASEPGASLSPGESTYQDASTDGRRVFFTDGPTEAGKLYMYDVEAPAEHHLTLLSSKMNEHAGFGVVGASDDGHFVYFTEGSSGDNPTGRLRLWHDEGGTPQLATIGLEGEPVDDNSWLLASGSAPPYGGVRQSEVSADGRHLLFKVSDGKGMLSAHGGVDYNQKSCFSLKPEHPGCTEVYVYDADNNSLQCASCNPTGAPATSNAFFGQIEGNGSSTSTSSTPRGMSEDGRYVFFTSTEPLTPLDTNGVADAYEYDSVTREVHLLSSGEDPNPSYFMNTTPDGGDVTFLTRQRLSGWDFDNNYDLYDARVNGGVPEPPPPPPSCVGDACQPAPLALNDPTPGSSTLQAPGNLKVAEAQVKRRVVAKHKHKKSRVKHRKLAKRSNRRTNNKHGGER